MTEPIEILRYARDVVLDSEDKWTRSTLARDAFDEDVAIDRGVKFCALGAVARAKWELTGDLMDDVRALSEETADLLAPGLPEPAPETDVVCQVYGFNDGLTFMGYPATEYPDVIDLFDRAVKHLEDPDAA